MGGGGAAGQADPNMMLGYLWSPVPRGTYAPLPPFNPLVSAASTPRPATQPPSVQPSNFDADDQPFSAFSAPPRGPKLSVYVAPGQVPGEAARGACGPLERASYQPGWGQPAEPGGNEAPAEVDGSRDAPGRGLRLAGFAQ